MRAKWRAAPWWLKVLAVLGVPWCAALVAVGVPLLFKAGPGLPLIWWGFVRLVPLVVVAVRAPGDRRE